MNILFYDGHVSWASQQFIENKTTELYNGKYASVSTGGNNERFYASFWGAWDSTP